MTRQIWKIKHFENKMNPFKMIGLAKALRCQPKSNKNLQQLAGTETYRKYQMVAEIFEKSAAMSIVFWALTALSVLGFVAVLCVYETQSYRAMPIFIFWILVLAWNVTFNQDQTQDVIEEAMFASSAMDYIARGPSSEVCKTRLRMIAVAQMEVEKFLGGVRNKKFDIFFEIFRAAGFKVGERREYFYVQKEVL